MSFISIILGGIFLGLPVVLITLWIISLCRFISAKNKNSLIFYCFIIKAHPRSKNNREKSQNQSSFIEIIKKLINICLANKDRKEGEDIDYQYQREKSIHY